MSFLKNVKNLKRMLVLVLCMALISCGEWWGDAPEPESPISKIYRGEPGNNKVLLEIGRVEELLTWLENYAEDATYTIEVADDTIIDPHYFYCGGKQVTLYLRSLDPGDKKSLTHSTKSPGPLFIIHPTIEIFLDYIVLYLRNNQPYDTSDERQYCHLGSGVEFR
jgi:hypothetical protein